MARRRMEILRRALSLSAHTMTEKMRRFPFWTISALVGRHSSNLTEGRMTVQQIFQGLRSDPKNVFILDGGTGEELFRKGVPDDRRIWSATAVVNEEYHETLQQVHRSFVDSGSQAITTNSYGITPGVGFSLDDMVKHCVTAGRLARKAVKDTDALVFGSLGPLVESYRPDLIMEHQAGVAVYEKMAQALLEHVDIFLAETMSSVEESMQAAEAVSKLTDHKPMLISYTLDSSGNMRSGESATSGIPRILDFCEKHKVEVLGVLFNCAEPEAITSALKEIQEDTSVLDRLQSKGVLLGAYANRLTPIATNWSLEEADGPQEMRADLDPRRYYEDFVSNWTKDLRVQLVGGCCGITPEHIAFMSERLHPSQARK